jgi:quinol monooxygenase YgiN
MAWSMGTRLRRLLQDMVLLIITVTTHPGRAGEYVAAFGRIAERVRLEKGCVEYGIYRDSADPRFDNEVRPDTVVICEKWASIEALQEHTRTSGPLAEFRQEVKDLKLTSRYRLLAPAATS